MMDKVSVIVPAYNVEKYLERCVDSLQSQTYQNIEIIIINDCSTDRTWECCLKLKEEYNNIHLLNNEVNQGLERTRERGISIATGEWIMFLDSDDTYLTDGVEKVMMVAEKYDPDWILCSYTRIINGKKVIRSFSMEDGVYRPEVFASNLFYRIPIDVLSCIGSKIYKRSFLLENDIHFNKNYKFNEDGAYVYSCLEKSKKIAIADVPFYQYWIRESGSIQTSYRDNMFPTISNADHYLREILEAYNCFSGDVRDGYYIRRASNMISSLENETRYRNYSSFHNIAGVVRKDDDFQETYRVVRSGKGSKAVQAIFLCIKYHLDCLLFLALCTKR